MRIALVLVTLSASIAVCACASAVHVDASTDVPTDVPAPAPVVDVDLLFVVRNSSSMRDNQALLMQQTPALVAGLLGSSVTRSLHVGVISGDLGTPGSSVPGCANSDSGDDGLLNPIRYGPALMEHEPWVTPSVTFPRPTDCNDPRQFPAFLSFDSTSNAMITTHDINCNVGLYVGGCGLESPLEAIHRALVEHDATDRPGNTSPNAGFIRSNALLAILILGDKEDASVRNCVHADGMTCTDALDVYRAESTNWPSVNLNLRFYLYQPGSAEDPTWPLDRYVDPSRPTAGWLTLKPGHPERIVFGAITGVPLHGWQNTDGSTNWDGLLGAPATDPNDFVHRDSTRAIQIMSFEGPVSMAWADPDPACPERVVPACRREGSLYNPSACTPDQQYFAWPSRRIVEIARRFDQAALCAGMPCHNGFVASVCANDYASAVRGFVSAIQRRLGGT